MLLLKSGIALELMTFWEKSPIQILYKRFPISILGINPTTEKYS
jgi:hypothetical protein